MRLRVDSHVLDAPVATVAQPHTVRSPVPLNARSGPSTAAASVRRHAPRSTVQALCSGSGTRVGGSRTWVRLVDGTWVAGVHVVPAAGSAAELPRCTYPSQVTPRAGLVARTGPGAAYPTAGRLPTGALAHVVCQAPGGRVGPTRVWDRLDDGRWVSDGGLANASDTRYTPAVPRC